MSEESKKLSAVNKTQTPTTRKQLREISADVASGPLRGGIMTKRILTKEVLAGIPAMVARGQRAAEIAEALGCKLNTLKVRCSRARVSLRPLGSIRRPREQRSIKINKTALQLLKERAAASGKTESAIASELLEIIARDNLFDAVLDEAS
jgi:hypothetical protein